MPDTNTLVLEILKQDRQLAMSILEKSELVSTVRHYRELSFSYPEINKLCQEVISILNKVDKKGILGTDSVNSLKKTGQLLWDQLLTKPVKDRLKTAPGQDLVLSLDEKLIYIPWELLYSGEDFLCLKFNLGRLIRTREEIALPQYRNLSGKHRMLILANPTSDLKSAYLEGVYIKNQFDRKRNEVSIDFKSTCIDTLYIKKSLRDYDIVHFAGHAEFDTEEYKNSGWVLSDGRFTIKDILALGESLSLPTLVFSNACHSAGVTPDSIGQDYQNRTYNLASAFLFSGTRIYIGTIRKIEDPTSLAFAREFYTQLIKGQSVGECMRLARLAVIKEYGLAAIPWTSYLLYGDPNFTLFKPKHKPAVNKFKRGISRYRKHITRVALGLSIISTSIYLYMWLPTLNPSTYLLYLKSHSLFSKGKNQEAILLCERIVKKEPMFLAAYPLLADTYQRLGKRDMALKCYFDYALYSEKRQSMKDLASAYIGIGWVYQLQGKYPKAFEFYNKTITLSSENKDRLNEAVALRKLAVWYMDKEDYDKALELVTKSSEINRQRQFIRGHKYNLACDYFDMGLIFINKNDFATAREFYRQSRQLFEKLKLKNELSDCYFNIGEVYLFEKQYQKALDCYLKGLKIDQAQGNKSNLASDNNMLGELYLEMDNLEEAEKFFKQSVLVAQEIDAPLELASTCYNLGLLYKKKGQKNKAREYLRQAQEIYSRIDTPDYQLVKQELLSLD